MSGRVCKVGGCGGDGTDGHALSLPHAHRVTEGDTPVDGRDGAGTRVLLSITKETSPPQRRRVKTAEDVGATPRNDSSFRSRATTVSTEKVFSERSKRSSKNRDQLQLPPLILSLPRKKPSAKHSHAAYPIASDMEEKLMGKIKGEIGRQYGGLSQATAAAITIQRWYRAVHMRRHYRMLHNMATRQPKKLRQRTQSMRQSRRYRRGDGPKPGMQKQVSILDGFPDLKEVAERVATPRTARRRGAKNSLSLVTEERRVDFSQQQARTSVRKLQVTPNTALAVPPGRASSVASGSMEDSLSILSQLQPGAISEFEVFEGDTTGRSRRESATTMRRKMNIGINYFNRQASQTFTGSLISLHCVLCVFVCMQEAMERPGVPGAAEAIGGLTSTRCQLPAEPHGPKQATNWRVSQLHPQRFQYVCPRVSDTVCAFVRACVTRCMRVTLCVLSAVKWLTP